MAKDLLVILDPGHYPNYNKGAVGGYFEGDRMYDFTKLEKKALEEYGIDVIITRKRDYNMELYARGQVAVKNAKGYKNVVFISNHSNAFNGKSTGVEVWRSVVLPDSNKLANKLIDAIVGVMNPVTKCTVDRGVKVRPGNSGDYFGVLRGAVSGATSEAQAKARPVQYAFIVEHGFHDNVKECKFLNKDANLKAMAKAEAKAIADYFGISEQKNTKKETPKKATTTTKTKKSVTEVAKEVIAGKWGDGDTRKAKLTKAGYNYKTVQAKVNELLKK